MFANPEDMLIKIQAYFEEKIESGKPITVSGLAYYLGFVSRQSLYDYKIKEEFAYIIKHSILFIESCYEENLHTGNCTGSIFALKNMGWKDKTETGFTDSEGQDIKASFTVVQLGNTDIPILEDEK